MAKAKRFLYLIDDLTPEKADLMTRGLESLSIIKGVKINMNQNVLEVLALRNPDANVETACNLAGTVLRTKMKKRHL